MSLAHRYGILNASRDQKLKLPEIPSKPVSQGESALTARVAKLESEVAWLRAQLTELTANKQSPVSTVNNANAPAKSDRKAYMRDYMRRKRAEKS
jgi:hypothetical protein